MKRLLFVCLGNICRSPLADGMMRHKVNQEQLPLVIDSAGTANHHRNEQPDPRMQKVARARGIELSALRARQFVQADFDAFDLIYAMDQSNYSDILRLARNEQDKQKVRLFLNERFPGSNMPVPDPYYGGAQGFIDVFNLVHETTDVILNKWKEGKL
jgi:protein-tyrosine phosphatase